LSTGGKTAVAVVVPVVVVALLVLGAILFWRRRKQQKNNEDERRKEVEEYGYNPNHDPTLPAVGMQSEMAEDSSGYRGWGNTATSSGRKASTTLTSGMTYSDSNSNPGGYQSPNSPTAAGYSDAASNDPLVNGRRETLDADGIAALGAAPHAITHQQGVARGPSNASSSYSAANHSDNSGEYPGMASNPQEYYEQGYGSYQDGPYGGNTAYGAGQQPVIRDVSARRNTRIENPSVFPQGNSGVATNF
jgi:MYXO-CTERM domain-containing protein